MNEDNNKTALSKDEANVKTDKKSAKAQKVEQAMENFNQKTVVAPTKKKNGWLGTVFLLVCVGLGIYFMLKLADSVTGNDLRSLGDILANLNVEYAIYAVLALLGVVLMQTGVYASVTKATTGKYKLANSLKVNLLGKYYDGITPFSIGGQPMQIYYLFKKGNSAGASTAIIVITFFFEKVCWLLFSMALMTINSGALFKYVEDVAQRNLFLIAGWSSWGVNALMAVFILLFAIFPKAINKILLFFINIITKCSLSVASRKEKRTGKSQLQRKIKILRRKKRWIGNCHSTVKDFRSAVVVMSHKPLQFAGSMIFSLLEQFLIWALPYFVLIAFCNDVNYMNAETMFAMMTLCVFATMSVTLIPTPGNSGVLESVVILCFKAIAASVLFWMVFTWRFMTYYIYIIIGIGISIFEMIRKAVRSRKKIK